MQTADAPATMQRPFTTADGSIIINVPGNRTTTIRVGPIVDVAVTASITRRHRRRRLVDPAYTDYRERSIIMVATTGRRTTRVRPI